MTHQCDWLAGIVEGLQKSDRHRAFRKIPHRAVPTGIENGVEVFGLHVRKFDRVGESLLRRRVLLEPRHRRRLIFRQIAFRIERRLPAFRRGERQLNAGIPEYEIGGREFLQPKTSREARVSQLVVRCQDHQYFHVRSPLFPYYGQLRARSAIPRAHKRKWSTITMTQKRKTKVEAVPGHCPPADSAGRRDRIFQLIQALTAF